MNIDIDAPSKTCHWCGKTIYPDIDRRCRLSTNGQYYYCNSECQQEDELAGHFSASVVRGLTGSDGAGSLAWLLARQSRKKKIQKKVEEERRRRTEPQVEKPKEKRTSCGCIVLIILGLLLLLYLYIGLSIRFHS